MLFVAVWPAARLRPRAEGAAISALGAAQVAVTTSVTNPREDFEINAVGTFNGTMGALELMRPRDSGHVVNVISLAGLVAAPGEVAYSASKHAAIAFTIGTLVDLRRTGVKGIDVSAVCPSGIWSPMLEDKLDDPHAARESQSCGPYPRARGSPSIDPDLPGLCTALAR